MKKRFFIMLFLCMMVPCIPINAGTGTKYDKEYTIEKGNMRFEGSILDKKKSYKIVTENKKIVSATKSSENVIIKGKKKGSTYVKEIKYGAFCGSGISNLEIEEGVEQIGETAFAQMKLSVVVLPKSIKEIGSGAFAGNPISTVVIKSKDIKYDKNTFRSNKIALPDIYEVWKLSTD